MAQAADDRASIKVEVEKWAWVPAGSIDRIAWHALEKRVCECPDVWWTALRTLIAETPPNRSGNFGMAPLRAILNCADGRWKDDVLAEARTSPRVASALAAALAREEIFTLLGSQFVVSTYLRNLAQHDDFDFWAWEALEDTIREDPQQAWALLLNLIAAAPDADARGLIGAGPLENFLTPYAADFIEPIEAAARSNSQFKEALAHVWIMSLRPDLIDRIETAAGVPLRRR